MIKILLISFLLKFVPVHEDLRKMREHYSKADKGEEILNALRELSQRSPGVPANIRKAYYAAAEVCSAQYKSMPNARIAVFRSGTSLLDAACRLDTNAAEPRYIRYTIQDNAPSFMGYDEDFQKDRAYLVRTAPVLRATDPQLHAIICGYFLSRVKLTEKEKRLLKQ